MALNRIFDMPRLGRRRQKEEAVTLADRARDARQWELAAALYREALDRDPRNPPIWVQYGHALKEWGELRDPDKLIQAETAYRRALSLDPAVADTYLQLGHVLKLQGRTEEAKPAYLRAFAFDSSLADSSFELIQSGWSDGHFSELRRMASANAADPIVQANGDDPRAKEAAVGAAQGHAIGQNHDDQPTLLRKKVSQDSNSTSIVTSEDIQLISQSSLFDSTWYRERNEDAQLTALDPIVHYLRCGAGEGRDPNPLFDSDWYLAKNREVAARGVNPLVHYIRTGAAEGRAPHPLFDTTWYSKTNPELMEIGINPLAHYLMYGAAEGRAPHPLIETNSPLARNLRYVLSGIVADRMASAVVLPPGDSRPPVQVPDLFDLRSLKPRGRIAVVLHLYYPDAWDEMRLAIERIQHPFDLFVSLVKGSSEQLRPLVQQAFPKSYIYDFENRGRDLGPFLAFVQSGALFQYDLVCKLHTKRSLHRQDGDEWRRRLVDGVLGSSQLVDRIISSFSGDNDLGMVVADGNIFRGYDQWASNEKQLAEFLPRIGISPDVRDRSFPGGSIFWIRSFLLRSLAGAGMTLCEFEPEPLKPDGGLAHAVERMFGLICEDAGMRVVESGRLTAAVERPSQGSSKVHLIAFYLPQFHPIPENDTWWGTGFTEWTNVTRTHPLYKDHRQPRLPAELGFYDLRLPEVRQAQAELARQYGLSAFCYYYYWFNGRRLLERPLDEVLTTGKPDFPFLICWANEPWSRNWDGFDRDILLPQTYEPGWTTHFARDVAPLLRDPRYFRLDGKPTLLIYRIGHIPEARAAVHQLRAALSEEGVPDVHLAAAWVWFPADAEMPADPSGSGLDAYFEIPPHWLPAQALQPLPPGLADNFAGEIKDYNQTVRTTLAKLDEPVVGRRHRGAMVGWDPTARKGGRSVIFHGATPTNFRRWLRGIVTHERQQPGERIVFINAWNEWAEGAYIEPDREFGRGWLEAIASATQVEWRRPG
jgi:lipopolysaccharide biosynthesis protein/tetratricopeptide (TPR) repeat protein